MSLEVNPIGTLDGRAVFEPATLSKRNSTENPIHRRPWLSRTDSKLHSQQQQPQTVSSEDEDSKSGHNEPGLQNFQLGL